MALKDKFVGALASRTGLPTDKAALALEQTVSLIKTKVPPHVGQALDALLASDNGIDSAVFLVKAVEQVVVHHQAATPQVMTPQASPQAYAPPATVPAESKIDLLIKLVALVKKIGSLWKRSK